MIPSTSSVLSARIQVTQLLRHPFSQLGAPKREQCKQRYEFAGHVRGNESRDVGMVV
jgi:hypothetical protein